MRLARLLVPVVLGVVSGVVPSAADIIPFQPETAGGGVRPLLDAEVELEREVVEIRQGRGSIHHRVVATFWLRSHAQRAVRLPVGFPLPMAPGSPYLDAVASSFVVLVDGETVGLELAPEGSGEENAWVTWTIDWDAGQERVVTCIYDMVLGEPVEGLVGGKRIRYKVSTGRYWRGTIGEATFRYRGRLARRDESGRILASYEENVVERSDGEIVWRFTDWTPGDEDLTLAWVTWNGLSPVGYRLPEPYGARERRYDAAWIDSLVEAELALASRAFPERGAALDRSRVRRWIGEHLLMEIRARNGDPFVLGRVGLLERLGWWSPSRPAGFVRDGVRYSNWRKHFGRYWEALRWSYEPDPSLHDGVRLEDLSGLERENAEFLAGILAASSGAD